MMSTKMISGWFSAIFDSASKPVALRNLVDALHRGGFLVVGATDGGHEFLAGMERCSTFLYRKP